MKKKLPLLILGTMLTGAALFTACTRQNEQALMGGSNTQPCDTSSMSYSTDIVPILEYNCISCHNRVQSNDGVILTDYADVLTEVQNGYLVNVIEHNPGFPQMPYGLPQLSSCTINMIVAWVNRGAPNN